MSVFLDNHDERTGTKTFLFTFSLGLARDVPCVGFPDILPGVRLTRDLCRQKHLNATFPRDRVRPLCCLIPTLRPEVEVTILRVFSSPASQAK